MTLLHRIETAEARRAAFLEAASMAEGDADYLEQFSRGLEYSGRITSLRAHAGRLRAKAEET